jgi:hypothetical protein
VGQRARWRRARHGLASRIERAGGRTDETARGSGRRVFLLERCLICPGRRDVTACTSAGVATTWWHYIHRHTYVPPVCRPLAMMSSCGLTDITS